MDPSYAAAWAMMSKVQKALYTHFGKGEGGQAAAERAIAFDPRLADAHAALSSALLDTGKLDEALRAAELGVRLDPQSYDAYEALGLSLLGLGRYADAIAAFEKATALIETSFVAPGMLASCYSAIGDEEGQRRAAAIAVARAERALAADPGNGYAIGFIVPSLAELGESERAKSWAERALLLDADNQNMRYNFACAFVRLDDIDTALNLLEPILASSSMLLYAKTDPDLKPLQDNPRFRAMVAAADARHAQSKSSTS
jgi:adenylate cyclase